MRYYLTVRAKKLVTGVVPKVANFLSPKKWPFTQTGQLLVQGVIRTRDILTRNFKNIRPFLMKSKNFG